jgi:vancomycin resistance protein VanJ
MTTSHSSAPSSVRQLIGVLHHFFRAMTGSYALSVALFLIARVMIGESNWDLLAFFNTFSHLLWIPALLLLPVCLLLRDWRLCAMLLPPVLAFALSYYGQFLPRALPQSVDGQPLTVLTVNLHAVEIVQPALDFIRTSDADLVALQQVSSALVPDLQTAFSDQYPYSVLPTAANPAGQLILSRLPIVSQLAFPFTAGQALALQRADLLLPDQRVVAFYNVAALLPRTALPFPLAERDLQTLLALLSADSVPMLMAGTFNFTDQHAAYGAVTATLRDAYREAGQGMGWTFPLRFPLLRIDYLFYTDDWTAHTAQVLTELAAGNHAPLRAALTLSD